MLRRGALGFALLLAFAGCKPGVGSRCDTGEARCTGPASALVCESGRFIETPCRGKDGCRLVVERTACDVRGNQPGDACSSDDEGSALCVGEKSMLSCRRGRYVSVACRGGKGCVLVGGHAECDETIAESGEACGHDDKKSCSADGKRVLTCAAGQTETRYQCRGPRACSVKDGKIDCDVSVAREGDACDALFEGTFACTEDAKAIVRCNGGKFVPDETCKPGLRCLGEPGITRCAKPTKT